MHYGWVHSIGQYLKLGVTLLMWTRLGRKHILSRWNNLIAFSTIKKISTFLELSVSVNWALRNPVRPKWCKYFFIINVKRFFWKNKSTCNIKFGLHGEFQSVRKLEATVNRLIVLNVACYTKPNLWGYSRMTTFRLSTIRMINFADRLAGLDYRRLWNIVKKLDGEPRKILQPG